MDEGLTPQQALTKAVNIIGSQAAMARLCGISQAAVWKWLESGMVLPAEHVLKVEAATRVPRHDLRPDLYPRGLQDGVPFCDPSAPAAGELSGATPEWPVAGHGDGAEENRKPEFQSERPAA